MAAANQDGDTVRTNNFMRGYVAGELSARHKRPATEAEVNSVLDQMKPKGDAGAQDKRGR